MDLPVIIGVSAGILGIAAFLHQLWQKRKQSEELRQEKQKLVEERDTLKEKKDEYEDTIQSTRDIIKDLQTSVNNGSVDKKSISDILDRLEQTVLPKEDQVLSKLDRLQTQLTDEKD